MITLVAPWALLGLLAVPAILWVHRRRRRPAPVDVPSLLFFAEDDVQASAPERVRIDAELLLALTAAALLALAAAGPARTPAPGRTVRVVVAPPPWLRLEGEDRPGVVADFGRDAVDAIRRSLGPNDRLELERVEGLDTAISAARAGDAGLRIVVADRLPREPVADVRFVAVGDPKAGNVGIAAVSFDPTSGRVLATVRNDGPERARRELRLVGTGETRTLDLEPFDARGLTFASKSGFELRLDPRDAVRADDVAAVNRHVFGAGFAPQGSVPHADAVRRALDVVAPGWREDASAPDLWVGPEATAPQSAAVVLVLHPVPAGGTTVTATATTALEPMDALWGRDLDPTGADLVYDAGLVSGETYPLLRDRLRGTWTHHVHVPATLELFPDPLAGASPLVAHPFWPLLLENVVTGIAGAPGPPGYRVTADLPSRPGWRLGRDVAPFDPGWLATARLDRVARPRSLRAALALGGAACLLVLWLGPLARRRRAPA